MFLSHTDIFLPLSPSLSLSLSLSLFLPLSLKTMKNCPLVRLKERALSPIAPGWLGVEGICMSKMSMSRVPAFSLASSQ